MQKNRVLLITPKDGKTETTVIGPLWGDEAVKGQEKILNAVQPAGSLTVTIGHIKTLEEYLSDAFFFKK